MDSLYQYNYNSNIVIKLYMRPSVSINRIKMSLRKNDFQSICLPDAKLLYDF